MISQACGRCHHNRLTNLFATPAARQFSTRTAEWPATWSRSAEPWTTPRAGAPVASERSDRIRQPRRDTSAGQQQWARRGVGGGGTSRTIAAVEAWAARLASRRAKRCDLIGPSPLVSSPLRHPRLPPILQGAISGLLKCVINVHRIMLNGLQ